MKYEKVIIFTLLLIFLSGIAYMTSPLARWVFNERAYQIQKVDDATRYSTRKEVEDSCRAMIASYTSDKLTYEQYKDNDNEEKQSWAEQARMRANKTASSYNEYVLKNSFVWDGNIPKDIKSELEYL